MSGQVERWVERDVPSGTELVSATIDGTTEPLIVHVARAREELRLDRPGAKRYVLAVLDAVEQAARVQ